MEDTREWIPLSDNQMPTLMGNYKVPHCDAKVEANRCFPISKRRHAPGEGSTLVEGSLHLGGSARYAMDNKFPCNLNT